MGFLRHGLETGGAFTQQKMFHTSRVFLWIDTARCPQLYSGSRDGNVCVWDCERAKVSSDCMP